MKKLIALIAVIFIANVIGADLPAIPPPPPPAAAPKTTPAPSSAVPLPMADLPAMPPPPAPAPAPNANALEPIDDIANLLPPLPITPPVPTATTSSLLPPPPPSLPKTSPTSPMNLPSLHHVVQIPTGATAGVITGGRVNIRAGDGTKYEIVHTADQDTQVAVFEKKGEWVMISFPEKEFCYIDQRAVDGDVPTDIPEQGVVRTIRNKQTKIYVRPWPGSTVVGELNAGENVVITGARGQYLRVKPPFGARAWVFEKFVRYSGGEVPTIALTPEEQAEREKEAALKKSVDAAKGTVKAEDNPLLIKLRMRNDAERKQREQQRSAAKALVENLDQQLAAIDAEADARIQNIYRYNQVNKQDDAAMMRAIEENYRPGPPPGSLGNSATGWIEHVAFWRNRPAEYRLVKGQEIICYLRSVSYNLADYNGRQVVISGRIIKSPTSRTDVLMVDHLRLFDQINNEPTLSPNNKLGARFAPLADDDSRTVEVIREPVLTREFDYAPSTVPLRNSRSVTTTRTTRIIDDERPYSPSDYYGDSRQLRIGERIDVTGLK